MPRVKMVATLGTAWLGDEVVVVGSMPLTLRGRANFVKVHRIGSEPSS